MSGHRTLLLGRCVTLHGLNCGQPQGRTASLAITCGIDWAENHHDVALVDEAGKLVAKRRVRDDADGFRRLLDLLAEAGDCSESPIPVAVETARGLLIACLRPHRRVPPSHERGHRQFKAVRPFVRNSQRPIVKTSLPNDYQGVRRGRNYNPDA